MATDSLSTCRLRPETMVIDPSNGQLRWTPRLQDEGLHNVLLRVRDGRGGVDLQFFTIDVQLPNAFPVITSTPPTGPAGVGFPFSYAVQAQDADDGDSLSFRLLEAPLGMSIDADTGVIDWTPTVGQIGEQLTMVEVDDGAGGMDQQAWSVRVALDPENISPEITSTPRENVRLGDRYFYQIETIDLNGDPLDISLDVAPDGMTLEGNLVAWTPTANQLGEQPVSLSVIDGRGGIDEQAFQVQVLTQPVNTPPKLLSTPPTVTTPLSLYQYDVEAVDIDRDPLQWSLLQAPHGMSIDPESGHILFQSDIAQIGSHQVVISVRNGQGMRLGRSTSWMCAA